MASFALVIAITAFLAGAATAVFVMLVIGIRKADRPRAGPPTRNTPAGRRHPLHAARQHLAEQPGRPRRPRTALTPQQRVSGANPDHFLKSATIRHSRIPVHPLYQE